MLARFGFWSEEKEPTRFDRHVELKKFEGNIAELRAKTLALEKEAAPTSAPIIVRAKHALLKALLFKIDTLIDAFNLQTIEFDPVEESLTAIQLAQSCYEAVDDLLRGDAKRILLVQRNHHSETAQGVTKVAALTGIAVTGAALSLPALITIFGALVLTRPISGTVQDAVGISTESTASVLMLERLRAALQTASLGLQIQHKQITKQQERERERNKEFLDIDIIAPQASLPKADPTICIITGKRMIDPVICSLDNQTYERDAIVGWLIQDGRSPVNRKPIATNTSIESVLTPNIALKEIIDHRNAMENSLQNSIRP